MKVPQCMEWECFRMGMDGVGMLNHENDKNENVTQCYTMILWHNGQKIMDFKKTCFGTLRHVWNILDHSETVQTHFYNICLRYSYHYWKFQPFQPFQPLEKSSAWSWTGFASWQKGLLLDLNSTFIMLMLIHRQLSYDRWT